MISLIVAHDKNYGIGLNNGLPWGKPFAEDMKWFREHTLNKSIVMGRKTFESIGKPLPKRKSIILTKDYNYPVEQYENCFLSTSINRLINFYSSNSFELVAIGGAETYKAFIPYATRLYVTEIHDSYKCDTYFSSYQNYNFKQNYTENAIDDKTGVSMTFKIYENKR